MNATSSRPEPACDMTEKDHARAARFFLLVLEHYEAVGGDRHELPRHQEEEYVRRREHQREAQQQDVVKECECANVAPSLHLAQISERVNGDRNSDRAQCEIEKRGQSVHPNSPGEQRNTERKTPRDICALYQRKNSRSEFEYGAGERQRKCADPSAPWMPKTKQSQHRAGKVGDQPAREQSANAHGFSRPESH